MELAAAPKTYQVGTLRYTLPRLLLVASMMILATKMLMLVCSCLVPNVKPILLDRAGADNMDIALIIGTIPQAISFILCPIISTWSDRTRSRFGRRIPYLIITAPLLVIVLLLIAWSNEIAALLGKIFPVLSGGNTVFWVLAILILTFQVLYMFPGSVVYYLIADVIPKECIGRFMAITTVFTTVIGASFSFFILKYAVNYIKTTFCIFGALYLLTYILLFFFVKEGEYPPVDDQVDTQDNIFIRSKNYLLMFFRQCFQHRIFVLLFICTGLNQASNICRSMYNILFATKDIGMTVEIYGKICGIGSVLAAFIILILGKIMDKTHPIFIYLIGGIFIIIINVFGYFFVYSTETFAVIGIATSIMYAVQMLAFSPLLINLLPQDKYGQLSSANSMINSIMVFLGSWLGGYLTNLFGYRVMFIWDFAVTLLATLALIGVYKEWKRLGGKQHYAPPPVI